MISAKPAAFKYVNRDCRDSIVLIPGWATDYRIFDSLDLKFNYLLPTDFSPLTFEEGLLCALKENGIKKVSLFGWSQGGFIAGDFASKHADLINELILVGIRKEYKNEELAKVREALNKNKKGYLYKFYTMCFCEKEDMARFKRGLLKDYCDELSLDYLVATLDYLENGRIKPELLNSIKRIRIVHGEHDNIAPIEEAMDIKRGLPSSEFITVKGAGHIPFLKKGFDEYL